MLEESIKSALKTSLNFSNIFGHDSSKPFEIVVKVLEFNQPSADFGMFASTLRTHYAIFDEDKNIIFEEEIVTEGWSDRWYFSGYKRSTRAATFAVAKNVKLLVDILKNKLGTNNGESIGEKMPETNAQHSANTTSIISNKSSLSAELINLSKLHSSGILTDEEFQKAKDKLLDGR